MVISKCTKLYCSASDRSERRLQYYKSGLRTDQQRGGVRDDFSYRDATHASTKTKYIIPSFIAGTAVATISVLFAGSLGVTEGGARPAVRGSTPVSLLT